MHFRSLSSSIIIIIIVVVAASLSFTIPPALAIDDKNELRYPLQRPDLRTSTSLLEATERIPKKSFPSSGSFANKRGGISEKSFTDHPGSTFLPDVPKTEDIIEQVRKLLKNEVAGPAIITAASHTVKAEEVEAHNQQGHNVQQLSSGGREGVESIPEKVQFTGGQAEEAKESLGGKVGGKGSASEISENFANEKFAYAVDETMRMEEAAKVRIPEMSVPSRAIGGQEKLVDGAEAVETSILNETDHSVEENLLTQQRTWDDDIQEAANFGLRAMNDLYYIKEPKLYSMGLYLGADDPARYVAAFNEQTEEARQLARFGYAVLEGTTMFVKKFPNVMRELPLSRSSMTNTLQRQCPSRGTPLCPSASLRYRTSDGSCNNLEQLWWGSAMSGMQRFLPAMYHDGIQSIRRSKNGRPLPSARDISNLIHQHRDIPLASITHMLMQWGQFIDHDLTATGQSRGFNGTVPQCCLNGGVGVQPPEFMHPQCLPIAISPQDSFFGPLGVRCLEFVRSGPAPREDCGFGPREQLTQVTSYLDASTVYSSNALQSDSLRIFRNGLLQYGKLQSRKPLLPRQENDLCRRGSLSTSCFKAGDGRLTEQPALTSLHVAFLRLHNRIATELSAVNPHWRDEKLFQETRKIIGAVVQHITYREFLPIVLGPDVMKVFDLEVLKRGYYEGYDPSINPTVANSFSTAAYRFGHSMVQQSFVRYNREHQPLFNNVTIHEEFSNPVNLETAGSVDRILLGLINQPSQKRDEFIADELTNHLFQTPRFRFGMDLASLNIQRGRDHGIPPYVAWREPCGLSAIRSFEDLERVMPTATVEKFKRLYTSVSDIDLFPAGIAENSVSGGLVGPTFACIIAQQFANLRRGDRFWYENSDGRSSFTPGQLQQIRRVTLAQVLCKTMDSIDTIQLFVFLLPDNLKNQRVSCEDDAIGQLNLEFWAERSPELRANWGNLFGGNKKPTEKFEASTKSSIREGDKNLRRKGAATKDQTKLVNAQAHKPVRASIQQNNRIVVRKPLGPPENVTILVQNNAVNAPVFVNDAIYGSHFLINQATTKQPLNPPHFPPNYAIQKPPVMSYDPQRPNPDLTFIAGQIPGVRPIPTMIPSGVNDPSAYYPHRYEDPSNPNPPSIGFKPPSYNPNDVIYESYPGSSPRPTLYTYYTNSQQKPTPQPPLPVHHYQDHTINYRPVYNNNEHNGPTESNNHYSTIPNQPADAWFTSRPNYPIHNHQDQPQYQRPYESSGSTQSQYPQLSKPYPDHEWSKPSYSSKPVLIENDPENWNDPISQEKPSRPIFQDNVYYQGSIGKPPAHNDYASESITSQTRPVELPSNSYQTEHWPSTPVSQRPNKRPSSSTSPVYQTAAIPSKPHRRPVKRPAVAHSEPPGTFTHLPTQNKPTKRPLAHIASHTKVSTKRPQVTSSYSDEWVSVSYTKDSSKQADDKSNGGAYSASPTDIPDSLQDYSETWRDALSYQSSQPPTVSTSNINSWPSIPVNSYQQVLPSESSSKPMKIHSVTILSEDDDGPLHQKLSEKPLDKTKNEVPRPLKVQAKNDEAEKVRRPGQYYYINNVLQRYPDTSDYQFDDGNYESKANGGAINDRTATFTGNENLASGLDSENASESVFIDFETGAQVIRDNEIKLTTTPTIVISKLEKEKTEEEEEEVEEKEKEEEKEEKVEEDKKNESESENENEKEREKANQEKQEKIFVRIESEILDKYEDDDLKETMEESSKPLINDRYNHWLKPEEDTNLPSIIEVPKLSVNNITNHKELPRPMILKNYGS